MCGKPVFHTDATSESGQLGSLRGRDSPPSLRQGLPALSVVRPPRTLRGWASQHSQVQSGRAVVHTPQLRTHLCGAGALLECHVAQNVKLALCLVTLLQSWSKQTLVSSAMHSFLSATKVRPLLAISNLMRHRKPVSMPVLWIQALARLPPSETHLKLN